MKTNRIALTGLVSLLLMLSACNFPGTSSEPSLDEQAATIVALTLTAAQTGTPSKTPQPANSPTLSITRTPSPTITPTYSVPLLTINEPTNCRTGPGQSYDILFTFNPGATVEIVGRYPTNNYWTVKVQGLNEPCWIWGEYSTASGSYWAVPSVTPPATATASPPAAPSIANWEYLCGFGNATVNLKWTDRAENESGYRIYRNDEQVTELAPNSNAFSEVIDVEEGEDITYRIETFNSTGAASSSTISFSCQ
ncbi:MAG: SH3 domain-containing protein [Anaerolineales bacterium]|nr:SH3 domain-containing protein [Anaerolineales bacterium]